MTAMLRVYAAVLAPGMLRAAMAISTGRAAIAQPLLGGGTRRLLRKTAWPVTSAQASCDWL